MTSARPQLCPRATSFVGRQADLRALRRELQEHRLVTVVGPPGIGKTRLGERYLEQMDGGTAWACDLTEAVTVDDLCAALGRALAVPLGAGEREETVVQLGEAIAGRGPALVVLDNFENVTAHAGVTVARWLSRAPQARFLVTSRERLRLSGEVLFELGPLSLPEERCDPAASEAVQLFVERAAAARRGYALTEHEAPRVAALVRYLDGNPLAIELVSARVRVLTTAEMLESLPMHLDVFTENAADAPLRHATLRDAILWSWGSLRPWEQDALAQCAVFCGGFDGEAAAAVVDLSSHRRPPSHLDVLQALRDKSLVLRDEPREPGGHARFKLYVGVRECAWERLCAAGGVEAAEVRHARYFLRRSRAWCAAADSRGGLDARRRLAQEAENLIAVHRRARRRAGGAAEAMEVGVVLHPILSVNGPVPQLLELLDQALGMPDAAGVAPGLRARAHEARGEVHRLLGHVAECRADHEAAMSLAEDAGDLRTLANAAVSLAMMHAQRGDVADAEACLARAREPGVRQVKGRALLGLGALRAGQGRRAEAAEAFEKALRVCVEVGDLVNESSAHMSLGVLLAEMQRLSPARMHLTRALEICRGSGCRRHEAGILGYLAVVEHLQGHVEAAEQLLEQALRLFREIGMPWGEGMARSHLGMLHEAAGRRGEARDAFEQALSRLRGIDALQASLVLGSLGALDADEDRIDDARAHLDAAEAGTPPPACAVLELQRGHLDLASARAAGDLKAAGEHLEAARRRVVAGRSARLSLDGVMALASLVRAVEATAPEHAPLACDPHAGALIVDPDGAWFCLPSGERVDCSRKHLLGRLLVALAEHRLRAPGVPRTPSELVACGWPGERLLPEAALARLRVALCELRKMGLSDIIVWKSRGYLIDPGVPARFAERR